MKDFKVRAWDKIVNKMFIPTMINQFGDVRHTYEGGETWLLKETDSFDLMLYSGINDCNNKQMCESDIIKFHCNYADRKKVGYRTGVLTWNETYLRFELIVPGFDEPFDIKDETDEYSKREILGNIYQDPQLLDN